ncbi:MAG: septum formation initiator family protein [Candidatus Omnitrophota bacterium]
MLKNALWLFTIAVILLIVFIPSYSRMQDLRQKNSDYEAQIEKLKGDVVKLSEEKERLENDPVYLEKVGREKMGIGREGEVIYKMVPADEE